ncbi:MAG: hypothetical protein ACI9U2_000694 [Bradymonadia bacterium]|jgi:hypothetical protein
MTRIRPKAIDLLAVGHVTLDAYGPPRQTTLEPGGSVLYAARAWRALGRRPGIVTTVGDDFRRPSAFTGLTVSAASAPRTTRFANRYSLAGDRAQHLAAQAPQVYADMLPPEWTTPRVAFLCPVLGEVELSSWREALQGASITAAGLQGWLKRADGDGTVTHGPQALDPRAFHGLDVAFLSEEDLAGRLDWLDALCHGVPLVYLTRGTAGCLIFRRGMIDRVGIFATGAVDPTGAGDTFAAGTLHAIADGGGPIAAARVGAAAASVVVEYRANAPMHALRGAPERVDRVA